MRPKQIALQIQRAAKAQIDGDEDIQPIFIEGPPGVGKSAVVKQVADELKIGFLDVRLVQMDPTDLRGCLYVAKNASGVEEARYAQSSLWPKDPAAKLILFLDELAAAPPLTQASAYQLTLDRKIGEYSLPDGCYMMAAGNTLADRAVVHRMSTALASRFSWITYELSLDDWTAWAFDAHIDPTVIGFLKWRPTLLMTFDPQSSEHAFACPRTWEFASRFCKIMPKSILHEALEGTVGKGAAAEFTAFQKIQNDLPDLTPILNGDKSFKPTKMDIRYALVSALAQRAESGKHFDNLIQYSEVLPAEFSVLLVQMLGSKDKARLLAQPSIEVWAREHNDLVITRGAK